MHGDHWAGRFLDLAAHVATWSKDPSTQVGAVIVRPDKTIASIGFNGFPRGVIDSAHRLDHRETKYALTVHAELNAILAAHENVSGCTLYVVPLHPCSNCAGAIVQAGIRKVVTRRTDNPRWEDSVLRASTVFDEAGVEVVFVEEVAA
jgi:dCMP deaminase